jgi:phage gp36-like protein
MAYCTQADLLKRMAPEELIALTDDTQTGTADAALVSAAILEADSEIDAAIAARYPLPLASVPPIIARISIDLTTYNLFSRRAAMGMPQVVQDRRDAAAKLLLQIANGTMSFGVAAVPTSGNGFAVSTPEISFFGSGQMRGY